MAKEESELKDFRDLQVWAKAHALALDVYRATGTFPKEELYGLTSQMRRYSVSIPSNIADGCGRRGNGEFHKFLQISTGSASELEYQPMLARDLGLLSPESAQHLTSNVQDVKKMLAGLIKRIDAERSRP